MMQADRKKKSMIYDFSKSLMDLSCFPFSMDLFDLNQIQQINPPDQNSADMMEKIVTRNERLYTFGAIHPFDESIDNKMKQY